MALIQVSSQPVLAGKVGEDDCAQTFGPDVDGRTLSSRVETWIAGPLPFWTLTLLIMRQAAAWVSGWCGQRHRRDGPP
jgi:hypothetical protein